MKRHKCRAPARWQYQEHASGTKWIYDSRISVSRTGPEKDTAGRKAFTLVEMLMVLAVIGILAALLLPAISRAKRKAQETECVGHLHQLGIGLHQILAADHAYPSAVAGTESPGSWYSQLAREGLGLKETFKNEGVWHCPAAQWSSKWYNIHSPATPVCYSYNAFGVQVPGNKTNALGLLGHWSPTAFYTRIRESEVTQPSEMMAIGDSFDGTMTLSRLDLTALESIGAILSSHLGRINVLFCDGHTESPGMQFVFQDTTDAALVRWNRDHQPHREFLSQKSPNL
ncbi:MAG: hypothetical protein C5B50_10555 [Verrucomicrobia bacterium]|nr:MAG: hypothetical protein C5B50_10555 [Verrucomicrobiota bacterium]